MVRMMTTYSLKNTRGARVAYPNLKEGKLNLC